MKGTDNIRIMTFTESQYRRLVLASRKAGKSLSKTVEHLFAEELQEPKN